MSLIEFFREYSYQVLPKVEFDSQKILEHIVSPHSQPINPFTRDLVNTLSDPRYISNILFPYTEKNEQALKQNIFLAQLKLAYENISFIKERLAVYFVMPNERIFQPDKIYNLKVNKQKKVYEECVVGDQMGNVLFIPNKVDRRLLIESFEQYK